MNDRPYFKVCCIYVGDMKLGQHILLSSVSLNLHDTCTERRWPQGKNYWNNSLYSFITTKKAQICFVFDRLAIEWAYTLGKMNLRGENILKIIRLHWSVTSQFTINPRLHIRFVGSHGTPRVGRMDNKEINEDNKLVHENLVLSIVAREIQICFCSSTWKFSSV